MKISYVTTGNESIASFRYRVLSPAKNLQGEGCMTHIDRKARPDADIVMFGKHWQYNDWSYASFCKLRGQKVVYDVCDDHFKDKHAGHYKRMCDVADMVTCNSDEMAAIIIDVTGRVPYIIPDPVLSQRRAYSPGKDSLLWYGQAQNFKGLVEVYTSDLNVPLEIILPSGVVPPKHFQSNPNIRWTQWQPKGIELAAERNGMALIPYRQGRVAKSANRVLEALWCGLPVITDTLPAVLDFKIESDCGNAISFMFDGKSLKEVLEEVSSLDLSRDMAFAQERIEKEFSQEKVAALWKKTLSCV